MKSIVYYDNSVCTVTSLAVYHCVICIPNQPKYLVDYDSDEKTVKGVRMSISKFFPTKP